MLYCALENQFGFTEENNIGATDDIIHFVALLFFVAVEILGLLSLVGAYVFLIGIETIVFCN